MMMAPSLIALFTPARLLVVAAITLGMSLLANARSAAPVIVSAGSTDVEVPADPWRFQPRPRH